MKNIIILLSLIASFNVYSSINATNNEILEIANEYRYFSTEELGEILIMDCKEDGRDLKCTFTYDIPETMCWYGYYQLKASYFLDHHGALIIHENHTLEWKE